MRSKWNLFVFIFSTELSLLRKPYRTDLGGPEVSLVMIPGFITPAPGQAVEHDCRPARRVDAADTYRQPAPVSPCRTAGKRGDATPHPSARTLPMDSAVPCVV